MTDRLDARAVDALERIATVLERLADRGVKPAKSRRKAPTVASIEDARHVADAKLRRAGALDR